MRCYVVLGAVVIATSSGAADAAFSIGSVDMGGTLGAPLVPIGGTIDVHPAGTDPIDQQNSGLGMYSFGALEDNAPGTVNPLDVSSGFATGLTFGGFWSRGPITTTDDDAFIARLRLSPGASIASSGAVFVEVQGAGDALPSLLGINESGVVDTSQGDNRTDGANYMLDIRLLGSLPLGDVYDVFVVVPTPSTVGVFGIAGLVG